MNENFIVIDATDDIVIGGFGNLEGNLGLLKYSYEEISQKMKENNNKEDDIRLVNSLLDSIRELQQENLDLRIQVSAREEVANKYEKIIDKAIKFIEDDYYSLNTIDINSIAITSNKLLQVRKILNEVK